MAGVVVGVGRSPRCAGAVRWAVEAAGLRCTSLSTLHVWKEPVELAVSIGPAPELGLPVPSTSRSVGGSPAAALSAQTADVLVLGLPHDARRLPHLLRLVLHQAAAPVVVVPERWQPGNGPVVVGLCGTPASARALHWAATEARLRSSELVVVYAWQVHPGGVRELWQPELAAVGQGATAEHDVLGWVTSVLGPQQVQVQVSRGPRLEALLDAASGAGLLVLGRGVHSRLDRLINGVVGDDLGALAGCPVAVVPDSAYVPG